MLRRKATPLTKDEVQKMRTVGRLAARTLEHAAKHLRAGITTNEIDQIVYDFTLSHGAKPAPLGYNGFPKSVCTSVNHIVCHGVPDQTVLKDGDIINVDVTALLDGCHGDCSATYAVGTITPQAQKCQHLMNGASYAGYYAHCQGCPKPVFPKVMYCTRRECYTTTGKVK